MIDGKVSYWRSLGRTRPHRHQRNKGPGPDGGRGTHRAEEAARLGFAEPPWRRQDGADGTRMAGQQCETPQLGERDEGDAGPHQGGAPPPAAHALQRCLPGADRRQVRGLLHLMLLPPGENQVRNLLLPVLCPTLAQSSTELAGRPSLPPRSLCLRFSFSEMIKGLCALCLFVREGAL